MKSEHMLMYALVFVLGFIVARMMGGRLVEGRWPRNADGVPLSPASNEQGCQWARSDPTQADFISVYC